MAAGESKRGKRLWRLLGLAGVGLLLTLGAVVIALHFAGVQRALFERAAAELEARTGLRIEAESVRLRPLAVQVDLAGLTIAAGAAEPFLRADALVVEVSPLSFLRGPVAVRQVLLVGPELDGGRPLPDLAGLTAEPESEPASPTSFNLELVRVSDAAAAGFELPPSLAPILGLVSVEGLAIEGSLVDGRLELSWQAARLRAMTDDRPAVEAGLEGSLSGPITGPLRLDRLRLDGDALSASAEGWLGLDDEQPLSAEIEVEADAASLLGVEVSGAPVRVAGEFDLRAAKGEIRLQASSLPAELARSWLDAELFERAGLAASTTEVTGGVTYHEGELRGTADLSWRRGGDLLAEGVVALSSEASSEPMLFHLGLDLLPRAPGGRRVSTDLVVSAGDLAAGRLSEARLEGGRFLLELPDLEGGLSRLRALWPDLVPEIPVGLAEGRMRADGGFRGDLLLPTMELTGEWVPGPGESIKLSADGQPLQRRIESRLVMAGFSLDRLVEGSRGTLTGSAEMRLDGERLVGDLAIEGQGLGRGEVELDRLSLSAAVDGRRVLVHELAATQTGRRLLASGEIGLGEMPSADFAVGLEGGWGPLLSAEGRLRLAEGSLFLEEARADLGRETASLSAVAPIATLSVLPGAEALASLPLIGARGPLEIEWALPTLDWATALGVARAGDGDSASSWVGGSRGHLSLDPSSPATAGGEVVLADLAIEQAGHLLRGRQPLTLSVSGGRLQLAPATIEIDEHPVELSGSGQLRPDWAPGDPLDRLFEEAWVAAYAKAIAPLSSVRLSLLLRQGRLELAADPLFGNGDRGRLNARAPLSALSGEGDGSIELSWQIPAADWSGWLVDENDEERALTSLVAGTEGRLELDLGRPSLAVGELRVPTLEVELGDQSIRAREPLELRLADGQLVIESARLLASGAPLELMGQVALEPVWRPGSPAAELVRELSLSGGGVLPAALLNPFLAGGAGEGTLQAEVEISGSPESAHGEVRLTGVGAGFFFVSPYALEVASPELKMRIEDGAATFEGSARVNEGRLSFSGEADEERGLDLRARVDAVRALLDYGLLTLLDGEVRLTVAPDATGLLAGRLIVDRGQLTRPIRLDSLLLEQLLPADLLGTELDPLEGIQLDLSLETRQGVRVKNNLADLKVSWEPVAVRGNLVRPIIDGRLEVDPGGLVYAYGQTLRLDSAAVVYQGLPEEVPTLELQTTTSLEDPSIGRLAGNDPFAERRAEPSGGPAADRGGKSPDGVGTAAGEALKTGLASFLGEQFNSSVGEALGGTTISYRAPLIFGEADPGARLTAATDLSARATVAASIDLRNAERQTYLLDLHDAEAAARLSAQLFTNDLGNQGGTLQQRLDFGGTRPQEEGPRLRRLTIDRVPDIGRRALKRSAGYRKGDRLPDGATFEIAVAVGELLRRRGYPDARVRVAESPAEGRPGVTLAVAIDSGPHVAFRFGGGPPMSARQKALSFILRRKPLPKPLRRAVAQLYRGDFYESTAIEEMRQEAVRAWRSRGHLDPQVTIRRELLAVGPPERRQVTVNSVPGERIDLLPPVFAGLPAAESAELATLFAGTLRRVELAAGLETAERRAIQGLEALGFPEAVIAGRRLSADQRQLTVEIEPGERLRVTGLELADSEGLRTEVGAAGGVEAGDPVRADRLSRAALEVETELREGGYLDADVKLTIEPVGPDRPTERRAVFALDRGPLYRLAVTDFAGLAATRPNWARRTAGLAEGEPLAPAGLRAARRRLYGTGLFSSVGSIVSGIEEGGAEVLFEVEEQPRYRLAYGLRWESEEGASVVVDVLDRNFLGRGVDLGMRALWSDEVQQLRFSGSIPGVLGPKSRLDLFALAEDEEKLFDDGEVRDETRTIEGTVQLGWQLGRRTTGRVYARYRDVDFTETFLVEDPIFGPRDPIEARVRQPFLGLQYIFDSRDDRVVPARGLFASLDLSYSDESFGSDIRYGRLFGQLHSFRPAGRLAGRRLTWAQSVRLGRAEAFSGQELLGDLLLLAGGEYSVRGYQRESLGPPELTGTVLPSIEDNSLFVINEELRFDLWEPFAGLIFFDAGNVWIDDGIDFDLFSSAGLGLRADTPIGLLRLDVAFPLDQREGVDPDVKLYFGLGNVF